MKILFLINHLADGGAERVAATLLNHLCENHDVGLILFSDKKASYSIDHRITTQKILVSSNNKFVKAIRRISQIRELIKETPSDLIISFMTYTNIYVLIANIFNRNKIIVSERITSSRKRTICIRILKKLIYPTADKIVFVTKADCEISRFHKKSIVIYNPLTFPIYTNYDNREKNIITIAPTNRWYQKGIDLLIKSWALISAKHPDWNLEILGGADNRSILNIIESVKQERIEWLGWKDNVAEILRTKSIFILASRYEGCPNSLIEAMSQGCACIGTNCEGGIKEIITDGVDGIIAQSENVNDIAAKIELLIDNENLRLRLSANAIENVKRFDKNIFFSKWDNLIEEITRK